jgi:hypothetical protein
MLKKPHFYPFAALLMAAALIELKIFCYFMIRLNVTSNELKNIFFHCVWYEQLAADILQ